MSKKKGRGNNLSRMRKDSSLSTESNTYGYIQSCVAKGDGAGGVTDGEWTNTSPNPHAFALIPTSSSQVWEDKTVNVKATHIVKMRFEIPVSQLDRITVDPGGGKPLRIFEILDVDDIQGRGIVNWIVTKERLD
jgi:hypothetical protein